MEYVFDTEAQTVTATDGNLPPLVYSFKTSGVTLKAGGYRVQELVSGGGHWATSLPGSLPQQGTGFMLDGSGHIQVRPE